jgi:hypothetical protein
MFSVVAWMSTTFFPLVLSTITIARPEIIHSPGGAGRGGHAERGGHDRGQADRDGTKSHFRTAWITVAAASVPAPATGCDPLGQG